MTHPTVRSDQIRDIHRLYNVVDDHPTALPMPSVGQDGRAHFSFAQVRDAASVQHGMRLSEAILSRRLGLTFADRPVKAAGSASYWIRTARMGSGLYVDLVALAAHKPAEDSEDTPALAGVA